MAKLSPYIFSQEFDNNGNPLSAGKIYTYEAGTSTPKATYTDADGLTPNANPIILDSAGRYQAWLDSGAYKFILKDSADNTIDTRDNVGGDEANAFGSSVYSISGNLPVTAVYKNSVIISSATATLSLLPRSTAEEGFYFTIKNASASGVVTIDPELAETIDGGATVTVRAGQACIVIAGATEWKTLFLQPSTILTDVIQTTGASGIALKNSAGTTALTIGASAGLVANFAGAVNVTGALGANGVININGTSSSAGYITLAEDTDNGANKITLIAPASIASDVTVTLPATAGTIALTSDIVVSAISSTVATTSGTTQDIALNANIKQFTVNMANVSLNGSSQPSMLLGTAGSFETTGYVSTQTFASTAVGTSTSSTAILLTSAALAATASLSGSITFTLIDASTNEWCWFGVLSDPTIPSSFLVAGSKPLSAALTRIRLTTVAGTATFDAGKANVVSMY